MGAVYHQDVWMKSIALGTKRDVSIVGLRTVRWIILARIAVTISWYHINFAQNAESVYKNENDKEVEVTADTRCDIR